VNQAAEQHLAAAEEYLGKGEAFYRRAVDEILAAQTADPAVSNREIGERFGRSEKWVRDLVRWRTTSSPETPVDWSRGSHGTKAEIEAGARKLLAEAPAEQVERLISELPRERQRQIGAAAGNEYLRASQDAREERGRRTFAEQDEIDRAGEQITRPIRQAVAGFTSMGIAQHLEQAADDLHELAADQSLTAEAMAPIERAHVKWLEAYRFAMALAGMETSE
jgi:hypothetical protein